MNSLDLIVIGIYLAGLLAMGSIFVRMADTRQMFAAGGQSPWWLSGLSAFMTTFSAGTFVVWGGVAYQHGLAGVSILMVIGIAALAVGWSLAARWKRLGYDSAAEYLDARFGKSIVRFYTCLQGTIGVFTMGGAVYAIAVMVCALVPLSSGHWLADPATGNLSVTLTSLVLCAMVILITTGGGLWAVLMTDALQFIILTAAVLVVVPLVLMRVGGPANFIAEAPEGFFWPTADDYSWVFLIGWGIVFYLKMGGEWAYIQRFACVPTPNDAKKSSYLFGFLYLVSPIVWLLPPMAYRLIDGNVDHEKAYILACETVLPAGILGLMIAAMCSATVSMVTTYLNVFAGAFTTEFYCQLFRPSASEKELVRAGRVFTVFLGLIATSGALLIPRMGTYRDYIMITVSLLTGPLVLPTIWSLFSQKIGLKTAWWVTLGGIAGGMFVRFGLGSGGWLANVGWLAPLHQLVDINLRLTEVLAGVAIPVLLLTIAELCSRSTNPGWDRVAAHRASRTEVPTPRPSVLPAKLCGWSTCATAALIAVIALWVREEIVTFTVFATILFAVGGIILLDAHRRQRSA